MGFFTPKNSWGNVTSSGSARSDFKRGLWSSSNSAKLHAKYEDHENSEYRRRMKKAADKARADAKAKAKDKARADAKAKEHARAEAAARAAAKRRGGR